MFHHLFMWIYSDERYLFYHCFHLSRCGCNHVYDLSECSNKSSDSQLLRTAPSAYCRRRSLEFSADFSEPAIKTSESSTLLRSNKFCVEMECCSYHVQNQVNVPWRRLWEEFKGAELRFIIPATVGSGSLFVAIRWCLIFFLVRHYPCC